ncbi:MAG TPA: Fic family protein [Burkholderiaceae bacterium]|jgi:Fic family protein|nr:Fic family protein [Burkholderiaceae bacterium]
MSDKNIGCEWRQVSMRLRQLLDNVRHEWHEWHSSEASTLPVDEISVRFHHQLVWIRPFPNGNGRPAR